MTVGLNAGHGAIDPGAKDVQGNYEREQMIKLTLAVADSLEKKGHSVKVYPNDQDSYQNQDLDIWAKNNKIEQLVEFHFDTGDKGSMLIYPGSPDDIDKRLNDVVNNYFGSKGIQGRNDLYTLNVMAAIGVPARLVETYGGSDNSDIDNFNSQIDDLANDFANAIVGGDAPKPNPQPKPPKPTPNGELVWQSGECKVLVDTLHVRASAGLNSEIVAAYNVGDTFKYDAYIDVDGIRWVSYIGSSGNRRYVARRKLDNSVIYCDAY